MICEYCNKETNDMNAIDTKRVCDACFEEHCIVETKINLKYKTRKILWDLAKEMGKDTVEDYLEDMLNNKMEVENA